MKPRNANLFISGLVFLLFLVACQGLGPTPAGLKPKIAVVENVVVTITNAPPVVATPKETQAPVADIIPLDPENAYKRCGDIKVSFPIDENNVCVFPGETLVLRDKQVANLRAVIVNHGIDADGWPDVDTYPEGTSPTPVHHPRFSFMQIRWVNEVDTLVVSFNLEQYEVVEIRKTEINPATFYMRCGDIEVSFTIKENDICVFPGETLVLRYKLAPDLRAVIANHGRDTKGWPDVDTYPEGISPTPEHNRRFSFMQISWANVGDILVVHLNPDQYEVLEIRQSNPR